jgi:carbon-monoxide dehydrogenase iron sulfur subunit
MMKKVYVNEDRCLGCHLCEYYCAFAHSGSTDMVKAFSKSDKPVPRIKIEEGGDVCFAVSCRHCEDAICVKSCITGAMRKLPDGRVEVDEEKCVGCYTCVLVCPYGSVVCGEGKAVKKCDLCAGRGVSPICVEHCPNRAVVFEDRGE